MLLETYNRRLHLREFLRRVLVPGAVHVQFDELRAVAVFNPLARHDERFRRC